MSKWKLFFSQVMEFLLPFCLQFLTEVGKAVLAAALTACAKAEETDLRGVEKARMAYDMIVAEMEDRGPEMLMKVSTSMVNGAIEIAVKRIEAGKKAGFSAEQAASGL